MQRYTTPIYDTLATEARRYRPEDQARFATDLLRAARDIFLQIENRRTADRCRLAISSAKGAIRIQASRRVRKEIAE